MLCVGLLVCLRCSVRQKLLTSVITYALLPKLTFPSSSSSCFLVYVFLVSLRRQKSFVCAMTYDSVGLSQGDPVRFCQDFSIQLLTVQVFFFFFRSPSSSNASTTSITTRLLQSPLLLRRIIFLFYGMMLLCVLQFFTNRAFILTLQHSLHHRGPIIAHSLKMKLCR